MPRHALLTIGLVLSVATPAYGIVKTCINFINEYVLDQAYRPYRETPHRARFDLSDRRRPVLRLPGQDGKEGPVYEVTSYCRYTCLDPYVVVRVPFRQFRFGQGSHDTAAFRTKGMLSDRRFVEGLLRDGLDYEHGYLDRNGLVHLGDGHHRVLSLALREAFLRHGNRRRLAPTDKDFEKDLVAWLDTYILPLMRVSGMPWNGFDRLAPRFHRRMQWLEDMLADCTVPMRVPLANGREALVIEGGESSWYRSRHLVFQDSVSRVREPAELPKTHPSVERGELAPLLDLLDRDYPLPTAP